MSTPRIPGAVAPFRVRFRVSRDDGLVTKVVTGLPVYEGAVHLARDLIGGCVIAAQVESATGRTLAVITVFDEILEDFFAFDAAVRL